MKESLKAFQINIAAILMMPTKSATVGFLTIKVFWNKGYEVITIVHDVPKNFDQMTQIKLYMCPKWPKFGNSSSSQGDLS